MAAYIAFFLIYLIYYNIHIYYRNVSRIHEKSVFEIRACLTRFFLDGRPVRLLGQRSVVI